MINHAKMVRTGIFCIPHRGWHDAIPERTTQELVTHEIND